MFQDEAESNDYRDPRKLMNTNESGLKKLAEHLVTIQDHIQDHDDEDHNYLEQIFSRFPIEFMDKIASFKPEVKKLDVYLDSYLYKQFVDELQPEA